MGSGQLLMTEEEMELSLGEMASAIVADFENRDDLLIVGILTRGVPLAKWLIKKIESVSGQPVQMGILDINLYRDDLSEVDEQPVVRESRLPFDIKGKSIILVDDVLYTGRTIRAAMNAIIDFGRPDKIRLAVMIDRIGFRELPIQAEYAGKRIDTKPGQNVKVRVIETDGQNEIIIKEQT